MVDTTIKNWLSESPKWHLSHDEHGKKPWLVQLAAMQKSHGKDRYAWFLEQGLGKTSLALNEYVQCYDHYIVDLMVVICPNSFKSDWALAPEEWGVGKIKSGYWPKYKMPLDEEGPAMMAINFEAARNNAYEYLEGLLRSRRVMLVVDESLALGNPSSDTTKRVVSLCHVATMVRLLNGTPIAKDVVDYFGQLKALDQLNGMNQYSFKNRFAVLGGFMGKQVKGMKNEDELYDILNRCSFRALKKDWRSDLPPKLYSTIHVPMTPKQTRHYREMAEDFFTEIQGNEVSAPIILTKMDKLRQIASGFAWQDGKLSWIEKPMNLPKLAAVLDVLDSGPTKAIVVYNYTPTGDMLVEALKKYCPAFLRGKMTPTDIKQNKDRFNNDPKCRVIVAQEAASFRGHTLIGGKGDDRANRMVFYENSFSYYHRVQIEDRIHRGAQDQECSYYDLVSSQIEKIVLRTLKGRKNMTSAIDDMVASLKSTNCTGE